ncbi:baculoviral IAP repeat-containing protein 3-like isoform X3 [Littorina saxatilis]|uniref:baculoviral IAP repeat-containing protein 3-like isoform X3 n=1 Tax=Littorina saxatilis TaxID=31220 RepID=UPI0038B467E6
MAMKRSFTMIALSLMIILLLVIIVCIEFQPPQEQHNACQYTCTHPAVKHYSDFVCQSCNSTYLLGEKRSSSNQIILQGEPLEQFAIFSAVFRFVRATEGFEYGGRDLLEQRHIMVIWISTVLVSAVIVLLIKGYKRKVYQEESVALKLKPFDTEVNAKPFETNDQINEESLLPAPPQKIGVHMKSMSKKRMLSEKQGAGDPFLYAFNKPTIDHLFNFRRDQCFQQTCTACPASVSLASHFASGTYGQPGSSQQLQKEGVRLASFKDFPTSVSVSAIRLSQAGFFYTGERDMVRCFSCGVTHDSWQMGDRPTLVHARISPNCPLVRGSDTSNLPLPLPVTNRPSFPEPGSIDSGYGSHPYGSSSGAPSANNGASSTNTAAPSANASVTSGSATYRREEIQADSAPDAVPDSLASGPQALGASSMSATSAMATAAANGPIASSLATPENSVFSGAPLYGIATPMDGGAPRNLPMPTKRLDLGGAVYPLYSQMDARKRSFSNWVEDQGLPAVDELITLGFFYAGYADCVRCFFCGIGLKSWEPGDIPAEVHARWRPTCEYLRLVKGDEFVDQVANGGRNVGNERSSQGGAAQPGQQNLARDSVSTNQQANNDSAAPANGSNQQGSDVVDIPDVPVVRRARETGYTDQQISEGIQKLRLIGMERAMEVMLVEVLTNLFRDNPPQRRRQGESGDAQNSSPQGGNGSDAAAPAHDADIQRDAAEPGEEVADSAPGLQNADNPLGDRQNVLQQENARLRNMRTCQRCHEQPVGVIFLPCGHIIACTTCAPNIRRCLRCDTVIRATANVYFS